MNLFLRKAGGLIQRTSSLLAAHSSQPSCQNALFWRLQPGLCRFYAQKRYSQTDSSSDALKQHCKSIFNCAVKSVSPKQMVQNSLSVSGNVMNVLGKEYHIDRNVYIAAFGKAVIGMVRAAEDILGDHLVTGLANVPVGIREDFLKASKSDYLPLPTSRVIVTEGAQNNMPDEAAHRGATEIYRLAKSLGPKDLLLVLISGGGSALLPAPIPPLTLDEIAEVTFLMSRGGATILDLNTIRKNLELLKGGGLIEAASPARVVSLILSDVIGDPLDFIASGPTVQNRSTPRQCLDLFHKFQIQSKVPATVLSLLEDQAAKQVNGEDDPNQNKAVEVMFDNVQNEIVGSNNIAVAAANQEAERLGYFSHVLSTTLDGDAELTGQMLARLAVFVYESMGHKSSFKLRSASGSSSELRLISSGLSKEDINKIRELANDASSLCKPVCIVTAGETTVHVRGKGRGGRNQQLVLSAAVEMDKLIVHEGLSGEDCVFQMLSAGTDGQDGPTPVAGALADPQLLTRAMKQSLNPEEYLKENDTYSFYSKLDDGKNFVITGLTGTNVMDIQILLINPKYYSPNDLQ